MLTLTIRNCEFTIHYGEIKTGVCGALAPDMPIFTIHYGEIKTSVNTSCRRADTGFTIHYGEIKTYLR